MYLKSTLRRFLRHPRYRQDANTPGKLTRILAGLHPKNTGNLSLKLFDISIIDAFVAIPLSEIGMLPVPTLRLNDLQKTLIGSIIGLAFSLFLAFSPILPSSAVSVADIPNPQVTNGSWVTDMAGMLSADSETELNMMISRLEATNGIEIAVVTVPDTQPSSSPKAFATELFNTWGIGKEGTDNGLLFLISKGDRRNEIETGYGLEGILSDAQIGAILREQVTPQFKAGNFDAGVLAGTQTIVSILSGETQGAFGRDAYENTSGIGSLIQFSKPSLPSIGFGWLFNGVGPTAIAIAIATRAFLKKLTNRHAGPIYIGPTGRSELTASDVFLGPLLATGLRALLSEDMAEAKRLIALKGNTFLPTTSTGTGANSLTHTFNRLTAFVSTTHNNKDAISRLINSQQLNSQLVAIRWHEDILKSGWKLFGLLFALSLAGGQIIQEQVLWLPVFTWLWLGYELWVNATWVQHYVYDDQTVGPSLKSTVVTLTRIGLCAAIVAIIAIMIINIIAILVMPFFLTAFFGACAGVLRLVRSLPQDHAVHCQACGTPMQQLSAPQLIKHTREAEKVEISLGNKHYEGWCCKACAPNAPITDSIPKDTPKKKQPKPSLSVHLFSQVLKTVGYEQCTTCDALTIKIKTTVLEKSTTSKTGRKQIEKDCQCCGIHSEEEIVTPKVPVTTSSSSSSYSSSSYSGSSYSSSSYDSGGSFGGGDSGGGGAGDSW